MPKSTNQAEDLTTGHVAESGILPAYDNLPHGKTIGTGTNFGVTHHGEVHYDTPTRSDANKD